MAKEDISFFKKEEFNDWLYDIGKKRGQYDSYINTLDVNNRLSSITKLEDAKTIVKKMLENLDRQIANSKGKPKKTLQSKRSGLRSYKRFLSYIPNNCITYDYNGIKKLAELFKSAHLSLINYMVSHSLFPKPELAEQRAKEIAQQLVNNDKVWARFSTGNNYYDVNRKIVYFQKRKEGVDKTNQGDYFFKENGIKVKIDSNGNKKICDYLANNTKINISSGNSQRNCYGYMISHIWGNAINPLFFSNFWNIVLTPQFVSFILDKGDEMASIKYSKELYKAIAYVLYKDSIKIINDALVEVNKANKTDIKAKLDIIEPDDDIQKDAKDLIKKNLIKYIPPKENN